MKIILLLSILFSFIYFNTIYSQDIPTHLFLGNWEYKTSENLTTEIWTLNENNITLGQTIFEYNGGQFMSEIMILKFENNNLNYCATILEQDPDKLQGEICFSLTNYSDKKFVFENNKHDFPKKIIYDFEKPQKLIAIIEGDGKSISFDYKKDYSSNNNHTVNAIITKEPFENKAGRIIPNVYDYFLTIQGIKYFLKTSGIYNAIFFDSNLNSEKTYNVSFHYGLIDSDGKQEVQSRIGDYITLN